MLAVELFGEGVSLPDFPVRKDIRVLGMSDWNGYADPLAEKLSYTNTYYHTDPLLDITDITGWDEGGYDFIISSEVFEHIAPPVARGFENCLRLLKPGGVLILTTPFRVGDGVTTEEHFPDLHDYELVQREDGVFRLVNRTRSGDVQTFDDLVFHDGPGMALEMRVFAEESLLRDLCSAGFTSVQVRREPSFEFGIYWGNPCSWPVYARRQAE